MDINEIRVAKLAQLIKTEKSQAAFGRKYHIDATYLSQMLTGHRSIGEKTARNIEAACKLPTGWLDIDSQTGTSCTKSIEYGVKEQDMFPRAPSKEEYALIPQYSTKGACGHGHYNDHVEVVGELAFKRDWLHRLGLKEQNASVIYAEGNSMSPTLEHNAVLLLDQSIQELHNGKIYALCIDGQVRIKRIHIAFGKITLVSDNPDKLKYPDEEVPADIELEVIGRGVWQGGGL